MVRGDRGGRGWAARGRSSGPSARARLWNGAVDAPPGFARRSRHGGRRLAGGHRPQPRAPGSDRVDYVVADIFAWRPERPFDFVLFAFWMSHVPPARFEAFWTLVRRA